MEGCADELQRLAGHRAKPSAANAGMAARATEQRPNRAQQIGEVMGLSDRAVRTLLCRARGEMRRALAAEGFAR